jgi:methyl-accepting chemotaxis protein
MATKFATAIAKENDGLSAGKNAATKALAKLGGMKPSLVMVFASTKYNYNDVVKGVKSAAGNIPLIGCSSAGEFTDETVGNDSVACAFLAGDSIKVTTGFGKGLKKDEMAMMADAVKSFPQINKNYPNRSAIVLVDGLAGKGEEAALAAAAVLGQNVKLVGGCAGDDLKFKETFIFHNDTIASDAACIALLESKEALAMGVKHGHSPVSKEMEITKAKNNVVYEVNGRPAFEVWKEELLEEAKKEGIDVSKLNDASAIGNFLIRYELGLMVGEEYKVRVPLSKNDDGSLNFACTMIEGSTFKIMQSPKEAQIESAKKSAQLAMAQMKGKKIAGAVVFDCVCRGIILGAEFKKGVDAIKSIIGNVPIIGFETYGEIAMEPGQFSGLHNTTTVILLIPA